MGIKSVIKNIKPFFSLKIVIPTLIILGLIGYQQFKGAMEAQMLAKMRSAPVEVTLGQVVETKIPATTKSAGRVVAKYSVDIVARIQGWLQKSYFKEGAYVKRGQILFQIEPNEYQNAVNQASASVREAQAQLTNDEKNLVRAKELVKKDYVSKSYFDEALAKRDATKAALDLNLANLSQAKLNLSYTSIKSPIDGRIGDIMITEGNLVNPSSGVLARIVSLDPIYVTFTIKSEDYLKNIRSGAKGTNDLSYIIPELIMSDGTKYPEKGTLDFVGNEVDQTTGTINLRATFQNKENLLLPGDFVTVKTTSTILQNVLLIPQEAVLESSSGSYVYIVENNKAKMQFIEKDGQHEGNWIIKSGLKKGDKFINTNLQKLKPNGNIKIVDKIKETKSKK